jgi:hypothetical protein
MSNDGEVPGEVFACFSVVVALAVGAILLLQHSMDACGPKSEGPWMKYEKLTTHACGPLADEGARKAQLTELLEAMDPDAFTAVVQGSCIDCNDEEVTTQAVLKLTGANLDNRDSDVDGRMSYLRGKLYYDGRLVDRDYGNAVSDLARSYDRGYLPAADLASAVEVAQMNYTAAYDWNKKCHKKCKRTSVDLKWLQEQLNN